MFQSLRARAPAATARCLRLTYQERTLCCLLTSMLREEAAEAGDGLSDLYPSQRGPEDGLVAVHHGLVEFALDVFDRVDHAGAGADQGVAVGLGPAMFH